jgi:hypothetical protein
VGWHSCYSSARHKEKLDAILRSVDASAAESTIAELGHRYPKK